MILGAGALADTSGWIQEPAGILAVLLVILAVVFSASRHPLLRRFFDVVPPLIFCYFLPTLLTTLHILPQQSPLYTWVKTFVLPACLLLLVLPLDVGAIARLGWKAIAVMLAGTLGVVLGGPIAVFVCRPFLPADAARILGPLAGSWIGGTANMTAVKEALGIADIGPVIITDVIVAYVWMGLLLYSGTRQERLDRWLRADATALRTLEQTMTKLQEQARRTPSSADLISVLALAFAGSWLSYKMGQVLPDFFAHHANTRSINDLLPPDAWKYVIVTTIGVVLSFTRARTLDGAGGAQLGTVMLYLLIACIGASADFKRTDPRYIAAGVVWITVHAAVIIAAARLLRAPAFFVAVGSQANIGGAASAPIVAAAYHPALAPVGVLLAVLGYVLGTYVGLLTARIMQAVGS
jgi:uncharacterized membrane protein